MTVEDIKRIKKDEWVDYLDLAEEMGKVVLWEEAGDYQGDTWAILRKGDKYGYLSFGWGSCSGCDALQGCIDDEDIAELGTAMEQSINWLTASELLEWFRTHDWEGDWVWHAEDHAEFRRQAMELLEKA